ncbi:MAG: ribosome-associated translation inhibitor RaiA, partial [Candidatus Taylorbacteria bacterium]|nr:ribosome-associated translation inhibitor RaiA [Candidatus Taylorbacteria bacterium]
MTTHLKGTNITLTDEIRAYLDKRLEGVRKFLPSEADACIADIELGKTTEHHQTGDIFRAEITIHLKGKSFRAVSEREDLYTAIDDMKDEITRELSSHKDKHLSLLKRGGQKIK